MNTHQRTIIGQGNWLILVTILLALSGGLRAAATGQDDPFTSYLQKVVSEGGRLQLNGHNVFDGRKIVEQKSEVPFSGARYSLGPTQELTAQQTILAVGEAKPYWLETLSVDTAGAPRDLCLVYPLDDNFQPMGWEFDRSDRNKTCDLLLYDRQQFPDLYAKAYGINQITQDKVPLPVGAAVLRIRVLYASTNQAQIKSYPVIRTDGKSRWLVIPLEGADPAVRVLWIAQHYQQDEVTAVTSLDNSKLVLRLHGYQDLYQFGKEPGVLAVRRQSEAAGAALSSLGLGTSFAQPPEPQGRMIACYDFNSLSDGATSGENAPAAKITDGHLVDAGVLGGNALYLGQVRKPSEGKILVPASLRQQFTRDQFTMSAWFKLPWGQLGQNPLMFWPYRRGAEGLEKPFACPWTFTVLGGLVVRVNRWDAGDRFALAGVNPYVETSLQLAPPGWQHVAVTASGTSVKLYQNGQLVFETTTPRPITLDALRKGGDLLFCQNYWGTVKDLRLYDYALSENQTRQSMKSDIPDPLLRYPMDQVAGGLTPATPSGEFPVDSWSWDQRNFKKEVSFAAEVGNAQAVPGQLGKALELDGTAGILIPPKATLDLGLDRIGVAFWFKTQAVKGKLLTTRGHWKYGAVIDYSTNGLGGVVCANFGLPAANCPIATNTWHHFIFCYDNYELRIFLDGKLIKQALYVPALRLNLIDGLAIVPGMPAAVDDIRVFGRMLNESDAKTLYQAGTSGSKE